MGVEVVREFLAHADVSQLKERCSGKAGETFAKAIHENCTVWFPLKQYKEHKKDGRHE
ncbi:Clp protease (plasmid) [Serratia fonticola]|nr:Clp protease [Serratia fonticola]